MLGGYLFCLLILLFLYDLFAVHNIDSFFQVIERAGVLTNLDTLESIDASLILIAHGYTCDARSCNVYHNVIGFRDHGVFSSIIRRNNLDVLQGNSTRFKSGSSSEVYRDDRT